MKIFIVFALVCIVGALAIELTEDEMRIVNRHKKDCIKKTGLMEEEYEKALKEKKYYFNDKMNCFSACMFKRMGVMGHDGSFDEEIVRALVADRIPTDIVEKSLEHCKNESGKDHCETAGKISLCFQDQGFVL